MMLALCCIRKLAEQVKRSKLVSRNQDHPGGCHNNFRRHGDSSAVRTIFKAATHMSPVESLAPVEAVAGVIVTTEMQKSRIESQDSQQPCLI